jgi:serine/threonine-protein kinase
MSGTTLGKYDVLEEIGRGGMAVVYRGYDRELEREVAIKILHPHLSSQPESKRRFHREARAVARLLFSNILEIFDYSGKDSEQAYIVTEFIHGSTLRHFFEKHPDVPTEVSALIALEVCRGLRHAHENSVIHRDIKPENIMIRDDGLVKITDFGIAQMAGTTQMTMTGQILGSPAHMSPEHVENKPLDFRADIFSMGTLLYWLTTGRLPFEGRNPHAVIKRIVEGDYQDPIRVRAAIGERLAGIIRRCLEVSPDDRYESVEALAEALTSFLVDLDISPASRELRRYFDDPAAYEASHPKALLARLIRRGNEERRAKNMTGALDYFNRALAIDERNEDVLAIVERMSSATRLRRVLEVSAVAVAGSVALFVALWMAFRPSGPDEAEVAHRGGAASARGDAGPSVGPVASTAPEGGLPAAEAGTASGDAGSMAEADGAASRRLVKRPLAFALGTRKVRIIPIPPRARIYVDGADRGEYGKALAPGIDLPFGEHAIRLEPVDSSYYDALEFSVQVPPAGPGEEPLEIRRNLALMPAIVRINTPAPRAVIILRGRERGRANETFPVRMFQKTETLEMVVDADGYRSQMLEVVLTAGQEYIRTVVLEPQPPPQGLVTTKTP